MRHVAAGEAMRRTTCASSVAAAALDSGASPPTSTVAKFDSASTVQGFVDACRAERLIVGWTLHDDRVVRLAPPLVITEAELDDAALRMERALERVRPRNPG